MLSVFPEFLNYSLLGIFLIRITIGLSVFFISIKLFKNRTKLIKQLKENKYVLPSFFVNTLAITSILSGLFMIFGILTQVAALVTAYTLLNLMVLDSKKNILEQSKIFYISFIAISISFIFLGPGFFGIDLPL